MDGTRREGDGGSVGVSAGSGGPGRAEPVQRLSASEVVEAREFLWLDDHRRGLSLRSIARREGLSLRRIQHGVARARERERSTASVASPMRDRFLDDESRARRGFWETGSDDPRRPPRLVPLFPIGPFTPQSTCPHRGPIRPGSVLCCMVCSRSGVDDHPALKRDPRTDPRPEPKAPPSTKGTPVETRRQRRQRLFQERRAAAEGARHAAREPGQSRILQGSDPGRKAPSGMSRNRDDGR